MSIPFYLDAPADKLPEKVFVYRNLKFKHRPVYSVRDVKTGRVVAHAESITLKDVEFVVGQKGRERVIREKSKNVHAFVKGKPVDAVEQNNSLPATYNPYKYKTFVNRDTLEPVFSGSMATIASKGVYYSDEFGGSCK